MTIEDLVAEGGELVGIAPTGKTVRIGGTVTSRFENGKWAEDYSNWDVMALFQQIGSFPQPVAH